MNNRWGEEGPPEEAYSRVTRDLAVVTAGFADYLDGLPGSLTARYRCSRREATPEELERLRGRSPMVAEAFAVEPEDADSSTLLVGRGTHEGGTAAVVAIGHTVNVAVPDCFCDACDADSAGMVAESEQLVQVAVGGFREFRRPFVPQSREPLHRGPWLETGYQSAEGGAAEASADIRGEPFNRQWGPWQPRPQES